MPPVKLAQRLVVRRSPASQIAEAQVFPDPLLQLPRRAHVHAKPVQPYLQHHPRIVGPLSARVFFLIKSAQVARLHHLVHQKTEMIGAQHVLHMGR